MSSYSDKLRRERRAQLASRALPNEFATKTEDGAAFPAAAYAYVPDPEMPSTWKLRLWAAPDGGPDAGIIGAAIAALGKGFRGNKVQIPAKDLSAVKAKVLAAWKKVHGEDEEPPAVLACGDMEHHNGFNLEQDDDEVVYHLKLAKNSNTLEEARHHISEALSVLADDENYIDEEDEEEDDYDYSGETEEFATCAAARRRVRKARRSLRKAIRALRNCSGGIVVVRPPMPTPPPPPPPPPPPAP